MVAFWHPRLVSTSPEVLHLVRAQKNESDKNMTPKYTQSYKFIYPMVHFFIPQRILFVRWLIHARTSSALLTIRLGCSHLVTKAVHQTAVQG